MLKTAALVAGSALGKVLGVARDLALAYFLGASVAADAFRVSLTAALVPTSFFMGDVLDGAFVPLYSRYLRSNRASARRLLMLTGAYLLAVSVALVGVIWVAGRLLVRTFAPGLVAQTVALATAMTHLMGLGIPFYCLAALLGLYGLCHNRFRPLALRSVFQNAGLVLILPVAAWLRSPALLGAGFAAAYVVYLVFVLWDLRGTGLLVPEGGEAEGRELVNMFTTVVPLLWLMLLGQILGMVDRASASFVGTGAIASLEYARVFTETPNVLVGTAVASTSLARFATLGSDDVPGRASGLVVPLMSGVVVVSLVLVAAAPDLVTAFYQRGRFDAHASIMVAGALRGLAPGAPFLVGSYILQRVLYAQFRSREVIGPMLTTVAVAVAANVVLMPRLGLLGVGLGMSIAYVIFCGILAARVGILQPLTERVPGWAIASALAVGVALVGHAFPGPAAVRTVVVGAASGVAAVVGIGVWAGSRADLLVLRDQVAGLVGTVAGRL